MGSGLAPGGACLYAAHREQCELNKHLKATIDKFFQQILPIRWVDDLIFCKKKQLDQVVKRVLIELRKCTFYGAGLALEKQDGNEAFGFESNSREGRVCVRQSAKYVTKFDDKGMVRKWKNVQGPCSFQPEHV